MHITGLLFFLLLLASNLHSYSQYQEIDEAITKNRKVKIVITTRPGARVSVEQLSHEFWFGCAITNSIASDRMPENDKKMFKEKFLENFNSAVTENALKWSDMEPAKGEGTCGLL